MAHALLQWALRAGARLAEKSHDKSNKMKNYPPFFLLLLGFLLATCSPNEPKSTSAPLQLAKAKGSYGSRPKLILDSDTANEIDDLFAIARLLRDTRVELLGLSSAQWFHVWSGDSTVYRSQQLNEQLLTLAGRLDVAHPLGADLMMGKPWGDYDPRPSPAAHFIIQAVKALPPGEKLAVMCIGASTNLASAIALDTTIAERISAYMLGFRYHFEAAYWDKDEFNIRRDLNAANYLLNRSDLELHIMPISVAKSYVWQREDSFRRLAKAGAMGAYLQEKWQARFADADTWTMWDVALLQAFLHPPMAVEKSVATPPENTARLVYLFQDIDTEAMYADYWESVGR